MSTKKSTKQKCGTHHKKITAKNKKAEDRKNDVLVLPPDLLQKLGINLEKIQSPQHSSLEKNSGACNEIKQFVINTESSDLDSEKKYIHTQGEESSILETANLMKASVFLSPTFSTLKHNIILDTENKSQTCIEEVISKSTDNCQSENRLMEDELKADNFKCISLQTNENKKSICGDIVQSPIVKTINRDVDIIMPVETLKIAPQKAVIESKNKINLLSQDEVVYESSENSNSKESLNKNVKPTISLSNEITKYYESALSCCIEYEHHNEEIQADKENLNEIQDSSTNYCSEGHHEKLYEIQNASKVSYVHDKVIKICEVQKDNNLNYCSTQNERTKSNSIIEITQKSKEPSAENKLDQGISVKDNQKTQILANVELPAMSECKNYSDYKSSRTMCNEENKSDDPCEELNYTQQTICKTYNLDNCQMSDNVKTDSSHYANKKTFCISHDAINKVDAIESEVKASLDKTEEIVQHQDCYTGANKLNCMTKKINSTGNSKLCIQGVEKPGGNIENIHLNRNIKTYSKQKNPNFSKTIRGLKYYLQYDLNNDIDYKINDQNLHTITKNSHNFCLCTDFGCFVNYGVDNSYGHIHFWERKEAECSVETLLSIYEDNNYFENKSKKDNISIHEEIEKENLFNIPVDSAIGICWNCDSNFFEKRNYEFIDHQKILISNDVHFSVNENEQSEFGETESYKGKRKRPDKTSESDSDCERPRAKKVNKSVKCGNYQWDDNSPKEHCFTVSREGHELVHLQKNLRNKVPAVQIKYEKTDSNKKRNRQKKQNVEDKVDSIDKPSKERTVVQVHINAKEVFEDHVQAGNDKHTKVLEVPVLKVESGPTKELQREIEQNDMTEIPVLQVKTGGIEVSKLPSVLKEIGEKQAFEVPVLDVETREKQVIEGPVLQLKIKQKKTAAVSIIEEEFSEKQVAEVPVLEIETSEKQVPEVPVLQIESCEKQVPEVPVLQIQSGKKQVPEVPVLQMETGDKQVPEVPVLQIQSGQKNNIEVPVLQVKTEDKYVTCGVCNEAVSQSLWMEHITQKHNYIAWKYNEPPLDCSDEDEIRNYLNYIIKEIGELVCKVCGLKRKFAKSYLKHVKTCQNVKPSDVQVVEEPSTPVVVKSKNVDTENIKKLKAEKKQKRNAEIDNMIVKCGVCKLELTNAQWMDHIIEKHDYLAWQEGEPEIDVQDSQQVYDHLFSITKKNDGLTCSKCGLQRKYVKTYLKHLESCDGAKNSMIDDANLSFNSTNVDALILDLSTDEDTICGVCKMDVEGKNWFTHVHIHHAYLAWKEGRTPLDLDNEEEVQCYLYLISKQYNGLICHKCGLNRKYVKVYLSHLESCDSKLVDSSLIVDKIDNKEFYKCAVCAETVDQKYWNTHAMKVHYNLAWIVGDYPLDIKNVSVVEKQLKEYKKVYGKFKCNTCGAARVSSMGFFAHIIQCEKTDKEIDEYKIFCDLCNSKYLCIYKSQHAIMHREQAYKEKRLNDELEIKESVKSMKSDQHSERRRAADKARKFIEQSETFAFNCPECGYGADDQAELDEHGCAKIKYKDYIDSENSAGFGSMDDESVGSAVDSVSSDEEICPGRVKRKCHNDSSSAATKISRIPFKIPCPKSYLRQSAEDYRNTFLTNTTLYPQWRSCSVDVVADDQTAIYLPIVKESCNVIIGRSNPMTYNLFEAKKHLGYSIFVGGCIQSISWVPPHVDDCNEDFGHFLAVAFHNNFDSPRLHYSKTYEYSGLLQIWDFGDLSSSFPKFALGIAHEYGTIWAIDWCPSGARDVLSSSGLDNQSGSVSDKFLRLGLLAIACSNGSAYILSVPYPSSVKTSDNIIYRLTPVAELRLSRGKKVLFQATSITWSAQKGHESIIVGYSNGTVASYNLECNSPLLTDNEGGVNIFYPFKDERPNSSCITDVKTFPSSVGAGLMCSVSPTGSEAAQRRGSARVHKHLSSASATFAPHWPALMLSGNEIIVNQTVNELDFWGVGRRTGAVQKCCGCLHCGHVAMFVPPVIKILTTHPAYTDFHKEGLAVFQMRPLNRKRQKLKSDQYQVKLEPLTYHDSVKLYALDFKLMKNLDKESLKQINRPRTQHPERFPLCDIPAMAFYPSQKHHRKLAVATHAGIIFILTDDIAL